MHTSDDLRTKTRKAANTYEAASQKVWDQVDTGCVSRPSEVARYQLASWQLNSLKLEALAGLVEDHIGFDLKDRGVRHPPRIVGNYGRSPGW